MPHVALFALTYSRYFLSLAFAGLQVRVNFMIYELCVACPSLDHKLYYAVETLSQPTPAALRVRFTCSQCYR
jgi:hypothetical protein